MSYRALAAFPFVFVLVAIGLLAALPPSAHAVLLRVLVEIAKVLAFVGLGAAALVFAPGDYLRRGYGLHALCYALLLSRDLWFYATTGAPTVVVEVGRAVFITVANVVVVAGTWTLARAWGMAGLELPGTTALRRVALTLAIGASLLFAGPAVLVDVRLSVGHPDHIWTVLSDLGDLLALPVLAPVALTAIAVRSGTLRWPWALLTGSLLAWLLYDAVLSLPDLLHLADGAPFRLAGEQFRLFAATSAFAAGLAQKRAVRELEG
jgi:hypothetical protein